LSFFFQAEDGIRDFHVTGVQTCALPIFADLERLFDLVKFVLELDANQLVRVAQLDERGKRDRRRDARGKHTQQRGEQEPSREAKIGRASCRERESSAAVGDSLEKNKDAD